jgi:hypothetical protein
MYEQKPNTGAIFQNKKKEKDSHPDMKGDFNIEGQKFVIAGWWKEGKNGKFLSVSVQEWKAPELSKQVDKPQRKQERKPIPINANWEEDSEIPF